MLTVRPAAAQSSNDDLWSRSNLLGTMGGLRTVLGTYGITFSALDTENLLGNVAGGVKQGATMQGLTTLTLQVNTGAAFNLPGGTFNVSALQIHGRNLSPYYLDDLQTASGTEAENATRLWELWYDQIFDYGRADVKIGQQSLDQEFIVSKNSALFLNTMAGWPLVPSEDLYGGGPAYPLSSLGVRVLYRPADNETVLAGVFDDNPPGGPFDDDPQSRDGGGVRFSLNTGVLFIAEFQYRTNQPAVGEMVHGSESPGLPGSYKIGFWFDTARFPDQAIDTTGVSLASPASSGIPRMDWRNYSIYAVVDQTVWQSAANTARTVSLFVRPMGAPGDRNLIEFSLNSGAVMTAPLPGRDNDSAGINFGIGKVGSGVAAFDRAVGFYSGAPYPVRGIEALVEASYQVQVAPWWQIEPDVQYVVHPGAGIPDPVDPARMLRNEFVVGVRTNVTF